MPYPFALLRAGKSGITKVKKIGFSKDPLDLASFRQGNASPQREVKEDGVLRELRRETMEGTVQSFRSFP